MTEKTQSHHSITSSSVSGNNNQNHAPWQQNLKTTYHSWELIFINGCKGLGAVSEDQLEANVMLDMIAMLVLKGDQDGL